MVADGYHSLVDGSTTSSAWWWPPSPTRRPTGAIPTATASSRPRPPWPSAGALLGLAYQVVAGAPSPRRGAEAPGHRRAQLGGHARHPGHELLRGLVRGARGPPPGQRLPAGRRRPHPLRPLRVPGRHRLLRGGPGRACLGRRRWPLAIARRHRLPGPCGSWCGSFHVLTDRAVLAPGRARGAVLRPCPGCGAAARSARAAAATRSTWTSSSTWTATLTLRAAHEVADRIEAALRTPTRRSWTWWCTSSRTSPEPRPRRSRRSAKPVPRELRGLLSALATRAIAARPLPGPLRRRRACGAELEVSRHLAGLAARGYEGLVLRTRLGSGRAPPAPPAAGHAGAASSTCARRDPRPWVRGARPARRGPGGVARSSLSLARRSRTRARSSRADRPPLPGQGYPGPRPRAPAF